MKNTPLIGGSWQRTAGHRQGNVSGSDSHLDFLEVLAGAQDLWVEVIDGALHDRSRGRSHPLQVLIRHLSDYDDAS